MPKENIFKQLLAIMLGFAIVISAPAAPKTPKSGKDVISGGGWTFTNSELHTYPWTPPLEKVKKEGGFRRLWGWVEYEFNVPKSGWYGLWLGGIDAGNNRDITIDGKTITKSSYSKVEDYQNPGKNHRQRGKFKECNVFLTAGKHVLRIQNKKFPGNMPNSWEFLPESGTPENMLAAKFSGNPIMEPGAKVSIKIQGGGSTPQNYYIFLKNYYSDTEVPIGKLTFPTSDKPISKDLDFTIDKEGIYLVRVKADNKLLRPSTLKTYPLVVYRNPKNHLPPAGLPKKLELMELFKNDAVLQQQKPVPVWGWALPGSEITVNFANQTKKATTDEQGKWKVVLDSMSAGGPHVLDVSDGKQTFKARNIMVGEVWVFAGQSNMGAPMLKITGGPETGRKANWPQIRQTGYHPQKPGPKSQRRLKAARWKPYAYDTKKGDRSIGFINGIAYAFCTKIHQKLGVAVGAIVNNRGGTAITTWTDLDVQKKTPSFAKTLNDYQQRCRDFIIERKAAKTAFKTIQKWRKKQGKTGKKKPPLLKLFGKTFIHGNKSVPELHYKKLIKPLAPYAVRGVCWYQGESDGNHAYRYRDMFPAMISNWRELWKYPKMPFIYAQIAATGKKNDGPPLATCRIAEQCEAQAMCMKKSPHTMMVCTYDLPTVKDNVHYLDKMPVGDRMAQAALAIVYGKKLVPTGPIYKSMAIEDGNKVRLSFEYVGKGLMAKGGELTGFSIAGPDKKFVWAKARIDGDTVVVWNENIKNPKAVRYNWIDTPENANLFNKDGLPTSIFRTDNWPGETINK